MFGDLWHTTRRSVADAAVFWFTGLVSLGSIAVLVAGIGWAVGRALGLWK